MSLAGCIFPLGPPPLGFASESQKREYHPPYIRDNYQTRMLGCPKTALETLLAERTEILARPPRCGDTVYHRPSGHELVVAYADASQDSFSWFGWPEGNDRLSRCAIVERVSDEDHLKAVAEWLDKPCSGNDHRADRVRRMYRPLEAATLDLAHLIARLEALRAEQAVTEDAALALQKQIAELAARGSQ